VASAGLQPISGASAEFAARWVLQLLYSNDSPVNAQKKGQYTRAERDKTVRKRYEAGERVVDLANEYGMTIQGIYRILRDKQ
jgi:hypothetical protein